jgi:citrate synthase
MPDRRDAPIDLALRSDICWSDETSVTVHDRDLVRDLIGKVDLGAFAFLLLRDRLPNDAEAALFNAALVSLVEHGVTPNALATRLTYLGAPESLQGAVAAGLLGLGSRFVGTIEGAAQLVGRGMAELREAAPDPTEEAVRTTAAELVDELRGQRLPVPGVGHPIHRPVDPRAERLFDLIIERGFSDLPVRLMRSVSAVASERTARSLPVNVTGAIGVAVNVLDLDWRIARGIGVIARTVGLVGHLLEEMDNPMASTLWHAADESATAHRRRD